MPEYSVEFIDASVSALRASMNRGEIVEIEANGQHRVRVKKVEVDRFDGLKVEIFSNEHPPPHFRVRWQSSTANYRISDCERLNGNGEVLKYEKNIQLWWRDNKQRLIDVWNAYRPSDCPVGIYRES